MMNEFHFFDNEETRTIRIINTIGFLVYISSLIFGVYNMIKFRKHRSYPMGVFYVLTILNLSLRACYFIFAFFPKACFWAVTLSILPSSFSCSIGISQTMNYLVFGIRLDTYLMHKKSQKISPEIEEMGSRLERFTLFICTIFIIAIPISIVI